MFYDHKDGISFRKLTRDDLGLLLDLKEESWWGTHTFCFSNMDDQGKWYDRISNSSNDLVMMACTDHCIPRTIGICVLTDIDWISRSLTIGGSIMKESRSPEITIPAFSAGVDFAFEMLNMRRLNAEILASNIPVTKIDIGHLGFQIEGRKREAVHKCGRYYDSIVLGLLRSEWQDSDRVKGYGGVCNNNFKHVDENPLLNQCTT